MKNYLLNIAFLSRLTFVFVLFLASYNNVNAQLTQETFESGIPSTWDTFHNAEANSDWIATTGDGYQSSNAVKIDLASDNIGDGNTASYFLVAPQISVPENGLIRFYTKLGSAQDDGTQYEIRLSTANQPDINGFNVVLQSWTASDLNTDPTAYEQKIIEIPSGISAGLNVYIAFVAVNTQNGAAPTGTNWFIDNVEVVEGCESVDTTSIIVDAITPFSADLTWTHPSASDFIVAVVPNGDPIPTSGTSVSGTSYTYTGLDAGTTYDAYVKSICVNGSESAFAGPVTFTTAILGTSCDFPLVVSDVFTQGDYLLQDNLANYSNPGLTYTTQGSGCLDQTTNYLNGDKIFFSYTASADGLITLSQEVAGYDPSNPLGNCYNSNTSILIYNACSDVGNTCLAATTTTSSIIQSQIENFVVTAGETYIIVMSSDLSPGAGICFDFNITGDSCAAPSGFSFDDLTLNSVKISWGNPGGFADTWEYIVLPEGTGPPTGAGTATATNIDNAITGLAVGATYDFYARSICGGTPGDWGQAFTFTTQCSIFPTPYEEDFTGASESAPQDCWYALDANQDNYSWTYLSDNATLPFFNPTSFDDYFVSPTIDMSGGQKRLRFSYETLGGDVPMEIVATLQGIGVDNFTISVEPETTYTETEWGNEVEKIIVLPTSLTGNLNFAFHVTSSDPISATRINITNFAIEDMPACSDPTLAVVNAVTTTTAELQWTIGYDETQWEIIVQEQGAGVPTSESTGVIVDTNPYTFENLDPATRYEYYVRAYCSDTEQSQWVGPSLFITDCAVFETPFYESFNDEDAETQKFCWTMLNANADQGVWQMNPTEPSIQAGGGWFNPTTEYDDWLISPAINVVGNKVLKFNYRAVFSPFLGDPRFGFEVLISTTDTDPSSFTVISPLEVITNSDYTEKSIYFTGTGITYIAIRVPPEFDASQGTSILNIDDVIIEEAPPCPDPVDLWVDTITETTAMLHWTPGFLETQWEVFVQPIGTGIPTTAGTLATTNSFEATNLIPGVEYEFYVKAICSDTEESAWIGPVDFRTHCSAFAAPFTETFNTDSESEDCWIVVNGNGDLSTFTTDSNVFPYEGNQSAAMFTGQNGENEDWLISPTITISENQRLRYYYRVNDSFFTEDLDVLLSTEGMDIEDFTTVLYDSDADPVLINNVEYKVKIINLPAGITGDVNIAFHVPFFASTSNYRGQTIFIDNVIIEDIPECPAPTNITLTNITDTAVDVSWDINGSETAWEISVQPFGTDAPVDDTNPDYLYAATASPFTVTGLTPAIKYEVYVRAVCDGTSQSEWTGPIVFTTKCSFENLCQYTIILHSDNSMGVGGGIDVVQNEQVVQTLDFPTGPWGQVPDPAEYTVFLCTGVEFSLFWDSVGTAPNQYPGAYVEIEDQFGTIVWTSDMGIGTPRTTLYTGVSACGAVSCPQPTNLAVNPLTVFSWDAGGSETQWEVAVQPIDNGTLPQSGTIVSTNSYTPVASDFSDPNAATYEFFVRAICGTDDTSYWSGPFQFVRNDESVNALIVPVNAEEDCMVATTEVSFVNTTVSTEAMTCDGTNNRDVWFEFEAASRVHIIETKGFTGTFYASSGDEDYPEFTMSLYEVQTDGSLQELACSYNNVIIAMYSSELVVGNTYKIRLTLNDPVTNSRRFEICITTPSDICALNTFNGGFEKPEIHALLGINGITDQHVVPGWRTNVETWDAIFFWEGLNSIGFNPYSGGQCIQILSDPVEDWDPNDPNIKGLYKDMETSEITLMEYSFAHRGRSDGNTIQLYAGPPEGPFTLVREEIGTLSWAVHSGEYEVPDGQAVTRFIFRSKENQIGNLLDAVNFVANNEINTDDAILSCTDSSILIEAEGVGTWVPDPNNPDDVVIDDVNSNTINITEFTLSGTYTFTWKTRYCEDVINIEYNAFTDVPTVVSPIEYCQDDTAQPLTATPQGNATLIWYDAPQGGTGSATAPTPDTTIPGTTSYYVGLVNALGCEGPRVEIIVTVNETLVPIVTFDYDDSCMNIAQNPLPILPADFTTDGEFTSTTLDVDPITGEIDLATATAGIHQITYSFVGDESICLEPGTYTAEIELTEAYIPVVAFTYDDVYCSDNANAVPTLDPDFDTGGEFSASPAGLALDPVTGEIDFSASEPGEYTITYLLEADEAVCMEETSSSYAITILPALAPVVEFDYEDTCVNVAQNPLPILPPDFTSGGVFASTTLEVDSATGEISLATATPGVHQITYSIQGNEDICMEAGTFTADVELIEGIVPVVGFTYAESYCSDSENVLPTLDPAFELDGEFSSSPSGLVLDPVTGEIDFSASNPGEYTVTYLVQADEIICREEASSSFTFHIYEQLNVEIVKECVETASMLTANISSSVDPSELTFTWINDNGEIIGNEAIFNVTEYIGSYPNITVPFNVNISVETATCSTTLSYTVENIDCFDKIPQGISPNGDQYNQRFDLGYLRVNSIEIFNRNGRSVYKKTGGYTDEWEGQTDNGDKLVTGTYYYVIKLEDGETFKGKQVLTGWVYINREIN